MILIFYTYTIFWFKLQIKTIRVRKKVKRMGKNKILLYLVGFFLAPKLKAIKYDQKVK